MSDQEKETTSGNIKIKGDVTGAAIGHGAKVDAKNIAGGDINIGADANEVAQAFATIYQAIEAKEFASEDEKAEVVNAVQSIEAQNEKGEEANENIVRSKFQTLAIMAPDILDVAVATFINPALGISTIIKKVAAKAKGEQSS